MNTNDEDKTILLLSLLPISFDQFKDGLLYGKEGNVTLYEVQTTMRSKELSNFKYLKIEDNGEGLSVSRRGCERKGMSRPNRFDKLRFKFFIC